MDNQILSGKELKQALFEITLEFVKYCEKHNLKYIMVGGTLLGAVRHKGFIPWDDDIDLAMPREDYKKLHRLVKTDPLPGRYKLESITIGNSPHPYAKVLDMNTRLTNSKSRIHSRLWIDIFPIDGLENIDEKTVAQKRKRLSRYGLLLENACCEYGSGKSALRKIVKVPVIYYSSIKGAYYYGDLIEREAKSMPLESCKYAGITAWGGVHACIEKEKMLTTCELEFEGAMLKAPVGYDEYLTKMYGDYMTLPPENKRVNHNLQVARVSAE